MLSKLRDFMRYQKLIGPGDKIVCAVSGGPDSMALLWAMYLLKEEWDLNVSAAHFNHRLRGAESDRDEAFVRDFCRGFSIPLTVGSALVRPGPKGLEAAAREARYTFLRQLPGKIATAHTADDNAETVLMHLIRGTGLRGLGGISPVSGNVIRPMLTVSRQDVEQFLEEYHVPWIVDSSNVQDDFLRNRLRHHVMPLLREENPSFSENTSAMALRLRQDEQVLSQLAAAEYPPRVDTLRAMQPAVRARALDAFLKASGVREPESKHLVAAEKLVFSPNPSAMVSFPGGIKIGRCYDCLNVISVREELPEIILSPGTAVQAGRFRICCTQANAPGCTVSDFTVQVYGSIRIRSRRSGDAMQLKGGTKSLKKIMIDRKIPASDRNQIPVLEDDNGILAVCGIGASLNRIADALPAVRIQIIPVTNCES